MAHSTQSALRTSVSLFALVVVAAASPALAQTATPAATPAAQTVLDEITVTAERTPGTVNDSSATVTVKKARELEQHQVKRPQDLVADEPGVSVGNQPGRGGSTNYAIRGIGENRVRLEIDGVEVPDYPTTQGGGAGLYTRDFIDFENLKQVEIVRGPASALYGSDAIGGVVSFITKDPEDFLNLTGKDWFMSAKTAYDSANHSMSETGTVAGRAGAWSAMASYTRRDGSEYDANGSLSPNPQDTGSNNFLAKLIYETPDAGRWRLTVESFRKSIDTDLKNSLSATTTSYKTQDENSRERVSLDWAKAVDTAMADEVKAKVYWTHAARTEENRRTILTSGGTVPNFRFIGGDFDQDIFGAEVQALKATNWFGLNHRITYGAQIDYTLTERLRTGYQTNLNTNVTTTTVAGEPYPSKPFPDTKTVQAGIFAQDEIRLGAFRVIPAVRVDYFGLRADPDALYTGDSVSDMDKVAVSPKLGVTYDVNDIVRLVGQYAHGFRAPPYDSSNYGFTNSSSYYRVIANADLKPEESDGFEIGARAKFANGSSASVTGFYNLYRDFISLELIDAQTPPNISTYQAVNLEHARIWGIEAKGEWRFRPEWSLYGSAAYARGEDTDTGEALDSVDPLTGLLGLRFRPDDQWTLESRVRMAARKGEVSTDTYLKPDGYAVVDAMATFDYRPNVTISAGVFNVLDKSYFNAQDVVGVSASSATADLFRAPGRSFAVSATVRW